MIHLIAFELKYASYLGASYYTLWISVVLHYVVDDVVVVADDVDSWE